MMAFASGVGGRTPAARKAASDDMTAFNISPRFWTADGLLSTARGVSAPFCSAAQSKRTTTVRYLI
jgi:hypothetical protein